MKFILLGREVEVKKEKNIVVGRLTRNMEGKGVGKHTEEANSAKPAPMVSICSDFIPF